MMMYTKYTWQDWVADGLDTAEPARKSDTIKRIIDEYKTSDDFSKMLDANMYFRGESPVINKKTILKAKVITVESGDGIKRNKIENDEIAGNRIASDFLFRFITQEAQYLLGNGVMLEQTEIKTKLGIGFDKAIEKLGELALLHGVSWGFWNNDHIEAISSCKDNNSGFVAILDEMTGEPMVGVQFWRINDSKPLRVRLFEYDGFTYYQEQDGTLVPLEKQAYIRRVYTDAIGEMVVGQQNYSRLPIIAMYGNDLATSEFTPAIKNKIDLYDRILSDLGDNLDRANDVYWVLNNFGGDVTGITQMFEYINRLKAVISQSDGMGGSGATAEPKTLEVPYQARKEALEILRKNLYADYMALDMNEIKGGSLTNVAIKAAYTSMDLKVNRFEWQVFTFVQNVLKLLGVETEYIRFNRTNLMNDQEVIQNIYLMRSDIDHRTALRLNPYIMEEQIDDIVNQVQAEGQTGYSSIEQLENALNNEDDDDEGGDG